MKFLNEKIKECREERKLSIEDLTSELYAKGLKVSRMTVYNWEKGDTVPDVRDFAVVAAFFNKPMKFFFIH